MTLRRFFTLNSTYEVADGKVRRLEGVNPPTSDFDEDRLDADGWREIVAARTINYGTGSVLLIEFPDGKATRTSLILSEETVYKGEPFEVPA